MNSWFNYILITIAVVSFLFSSGCEAECYCESIPAELIIQDENGDSLVADEVVYTVDDIEVSISNDQLKQSTITLYGTVPGTYHIWVTLGEQQWESNDIEIEMGGPEDCRRPITQQIIVTFGEDTVSSEMVQIEIC